jgi:hypothetical protein
LFPAATIPVTERTQAWRELARIFEERPARELVDPVSSAERVIANPTSNPPRLICQHLKEL